MSPLTHNNTVPGTLESPHFLSSKSKQRTVRHQTKTTLGSYIHFDILYTHLLHVLQSQIPGSLQKKTETCNQDDVPIQEISNPAAVIFGKSSVADAQDKDLEIIIMTMFKDLHEYE